MRDPHAALEPRCGHPRYITVQAGSSTVLMKTTYTMWQICRSGSAWRACEIYVDWKINTRRAADWIQQSDERYPVPYGATVLEEPWPS
jgi:hypothetical protein